MSKVTTYTGYNDAPDYKKAKIPKEKQYPLPAPYNKKDGTLEKDVLKATKDVLDSLGGYWWRIENSGVIHGGTMCASKMKGLPDLMWLKDGILYFIEVKAPGGHVSQSQINCLQRCQENGGLPLILVSPKKFLELLEWDEERDWPEVEGVAVI